MFLNTRVANAPLVPILFSTHVSGCPGNGGWPYCRRFHKIGTAMYNLLDTRWAAGCNLPLLAQPKVIGQCPVQLDHRRVSLSFVVRSLDCPQEDTRGRGSQMVQLTLGVFRGRHIAG
jgi:hypothetical protein